MKPRPSIPVMLIQRLRLGYTQNDVADKVGVSQTIISWFEHGLTDERLGPDEELTKKVAEVLGIPPEWLLRDYEDWVREGMDLTLDTDEIRERADREFDLV